MSRTEGLYVDEDGYTTVVRELQTIHDLLAPFTTKIMQKEGTGIAALCDQSIADAVAQTQSAWSGENALNVRVLAEAGRKMTDSLDRYRTTDGAGAQRVNVTIGQAGSATGA